MPDCAESSLWLAGVCSVDITPQPGEPMGCFPVRAPDKLRMAEGAHDRLSATALALGGDVDGIVIGGVDVPMIRQDQLLRVREMVARLDASIPVDRIILAASHTHHSLDTCYVFGIGPEHPSIGTLLEQVTDAIVGAWRDREPVTLHTGVTEADLSHNRRVIDDRGKSILAFDRQPGVTTGPADSQIPVWLLRRPDGSNKAVLFQFTAHALAIGAANRLFTADFPGAARQTLVEKLPGTTPIFVNGAAGDIHPCQSMKTDFSSVEMIGAALGKAVLDALPLLTEQRGKTICLMTRELQFTNRVDPTLRVAVLLSCVRVGPWLVAIVPGELFVEYQLRLKAALAPTPVLLIGYANGWPGYIPTTQAYDDGGYGVDLFTNDPPLYSRTALPPGAGETIYDALLELSRSVLTRDTQT